MNLFTGGYNRYSVRRSIGKFLSLFGSSVPVVEENRHTVQQ